MQRATAILGEWIPRLGKFSKEVLVRMPENIDSILKKMPQTWKDCGLEQAVLIGDCTDVMTEGSGELVTSSQLQSEKSKRNAAMGLQFCTPNGFIAVATDLFLGRTSENEACKQAATILNKIPGKFAFLYDRGVSKLQVYLKHLNRILRPTMLRGQERFTIAQGCHDRAITSNRYVVEVPFARCKNWGMLGGVVKSGDFHHLNSVWWWSLGFQNLCMKELA